jgi:hypothetical protein
MVVEYRIPISRAIAPASRFKQNRIVTSMVYIEFILYNRRIKQTINRLSSKVVGDCQKESRSSLGERTGHTLPLYDTNHLHKKLPVSVKIVGKKSSLGRYSSSEKRKRKGTQRRYI